MDLFFLRNEIKYIISVRQALSIQNQLGRLLPRDSYCTAGAYSVRSLYFDSISNIDFSDKLAGLYSRKKLRLRIYNRDPSLCKLEIKQKSGNMQQKRSSVISAADAIELTRGDYSILRNYFHDSSTAVKAYCIMMQGQYLPAVQVEYDRFAYRYPMYDTRITLDMNIRTTESNVDIFSSHINYVPIMPESIVLEIKYSGKLMGFISDMLSRYNLTQSSYSKYCSGRQIHYDFIY